MPIMNDIALALVKTAFAVSPVTVDATGTYQFSPSVSQEEACKRAEDRAKTQALAKVFGQDFAVDSTMSCRESDSHSCDSIQNVYENTRGYIKSIVSRQEQVSGWSCTVNLRAEVMQPKKFPKAIQAQARLDRVTYTNSDNIALSVETSTRGMVTVFKYDPIRDEVTKIFPMPNYNGNMWTHEQLPLRVNIPARQFADRDAPYYLLVTVSGGPLDTMSKYRLHEFYEMYDNIPYADVTYVRKSFYVSRSHL